MISPLARALRDELLLRVLPYTTDGPCTAEAKQVVREILAPTDAEMNEVMEREQARNDADSAAVAA